MTFLETSGETNGDLLRVEVVLPPGFSIAEHVHPRQEERHEVLSGTLRARVGGQERDYKAGERVVGPPGVPHAWCNPSDHEDLRIVSEHRPVSHMEHMLEAGFAIARDFEANKKGAPSTYCELRCYSTRSRRTSTTPERRCGRSWRWLWR